MCVSLRNVVGNNRAGCCYCLWGQGRKYLTGTQLATLAHDEIGKSIYKPSAI